MIHKNKIVSFISYKGGVGRSLTLVNVAYALCAMGKRVGCIDLDLDAPGLKVIFGLDFNPADPLTSASILATGELLSVDQAILEVPSKGTGAIFLVPAKMNQPEIVEKIAWTQDATTTTLQHICNRFSDLKNLDVLLIDAKAGLGKSSGLSLSLSRLLVCVFRIDRQSLEGTKYMAHVNKAFGKPTLYIPSMVPKSSKAAALLKELKKDLPLEDEINYSSNMVIDEKVLLRDSPRNKSADVYRKLAKHILNLL